MDNNSLPNIVTLSIVLARSSIPTRHIRRPRKYPSGRHHPDRSSGDRVSLDSGTSDGCAIQFPRCSDAFLYCGTLLSTDSLRNNGTLVVFDSFTTNGTHGTFDSFTANLVLSVLVTRSPSMALSVELTRFPLMVLFGSLTRSNAMVLLWALTRSNTMALFASFDSFPYHGTLIVSD